MDYFIWNIDPEIFSLGPFTIGGATIGPLGLRYYGLLFATGFLLGFQYMNHVFKLEGQDEMDLNSLLTHLVVGTVVGARLGHCLFYEPGYYLANPIEILKIWNGGLASHGGTIGCIVSVWLFCKKHNEIGYIWVADRLAAPIALTGAFIRLGNFFNSEIVGRETDVPWAIVFERIDMLPRHPAMLYESFAYFLIAGILFLLYRKHGRDLEQGKLIGIMFMWIFSVRIILEFFKENQVAFEESMLLNMGQLLSVPFIIVGILFYTGKMAQLLGLSSSEVNRR